MLHALRSVRIGLQIARTRRRRDLEHNAIRIGEVERVLRAVVLFAEDNPVLSEAALPLLLLSG